MVLQSIIFLAVIRLKIMFISIPWGCTNFKTLGFFPCVFNVQDIIGGHRYDIFALYSMHETTFIDTHQAQNEQFSFFLLFFPQKNAIFNTCNKKTSMNFTKTFNIYLEESLELKESIFKLLDHLLYIKYDLSKKA